MDNNQINYIYIYIYFRFFFGANFKEFDYDKLDSLNNLIDL